jgi:hypothetical protein
VPGEHRRRHLLYANSVPGIGPSPEAPVARFNTSPSLPDRRHEGQLPLRVLLEPAARREPGARWVNS